MSAGGVSGPGLSDYLLCATPRTGSTLLCSLLASTGVLGRPASFFREPDEVAWANRLGVAVRDGRVYDYVDALARAGFRLTVLRECEPVEPAFHGVRGEFERRRRIPLFLLLGASPS